MYLHVSLQVLYPVQFPDVEVEDLPVLLGELSPEFVHVAVAPLPGVRRVRFYGRGGLLHEAGDLDEEGFLAEDPEDDVHEVCGAVVEDELGRETVSKVTGEKRRRSLPTWHTLLA